MENTETNTIVVCVIMLWWVEADVQHIQCTQMSVWWMTFTFKYHLILAECHAIWQACIVRHILFYFVPCWYPHYAMFYLIELNWIFYFCSHNTPKHSKTTGSCKNNAGIRVLRNIGFQESISLSSWFPNSKIKSNVKQMERKKTIHRSKS
jgi:hypothetical protein